MSGNSLTFVFLSNTYASVIKQLYLSYIRLNHPDAEMASTHAAKVYATRIVHHISIRIVLVCYSLFIMKPCLPVLQDAVAHTFWKHTHLLQVHGKEGKHHLQVAVSKAVDGAEKDHSNNKARYQAAESECLMPSADFTVFSRYISLIHYPVAVDNYSGVLLLPDHIPPKTV